MNSFEKIREWLSREDPVISGRIRTVYLRCGKSTCKCRSGEDSDKHGPYYFWDRKVDGKLTSSSIPAESLKTFQGWLKNRKQLEKLVADIKEKGDTKALKSLNSDSNNPVC